jgi:hypothetical protein
LCTTQSTQFLLQLNTQRAWVSVHLGGLCSALCTAPENRSRCLLENSHSGHGKHTGTSTHPHRHTCTATGQQTQTHTRASAEEASNGTRAWVHGLLPMLQVLHRDDVISQQAGATCLRRALSRWTSRGSPVGRGNVQPHGGSGMGRRRAFHSRGQQLNTRRHYAPDVREWPFPTHASPPWYPLYRFMFSMSSPYA